MPLNFQNEFLQVSASGIPEKTWSYLDSCATSN
jgi:hypothetical protein